MNLSTMITRLKSIKVIGRSKVQFHLDDIVLFRQQADGRYFWYCRMAEPQPLAHGVACGTYEENINTQFLAEERALEHITTVHRGVGGQRRPKHRGRERREKEIARWNARHGQFINETREGK